MTSRRIYGFGGTTALTIDHLPNTNVDYGDERAKGLRQLLESGL
jgi:hypothetical protein